MRVAGCSFEVAVGQKREVEVAALNMERVPGLSGSGGLGGSAAADGVAADADAAAEKDGACRS